VTDPKTVLSFMLVFFLRLRWAFAFVRIIPRDVCLTGFLLYQPIMFALSLGGTLGFGLADWGVQL
jgi:hypothetical protein